MDGVILPHRDPYRDDPRTALRRRRPNGRFLERDEFCRLLVSRRELSRVEDTKAGVRGLRDAGTGQTFWIEEGKLLHESS